MMTTDPKKVAVRAAMILNDKPRGGKKGIFLFLVLMRKIKSSKKLCDHFAQ